jgi:hypothetical protein
MDRYTREANKKRKNSMTLEKFKSQNEEFYNFLKQYTQPKDNRFIHDINNDFKKPYSTDTKINNLIVSVSHYHNLPQFNEFRGIVYFKEHCNDFYKYLKYLLLLDDSTILRLLYRCRFMTLYNNLNNWDIIENNCIRQSLHYNEFRQNHQTFYNSYCVSININREKELYSSNINLIDFIEKYNEYYRYLREVKKMSVIDIIEYLDNNSYNKNKSYQELRIIVENNHLYFGYIKHVREYYDNYLKFIEMNQLSDTDLKNYILDIETQIREEAERIDNYNSAASTHKNSSSSRSSGIVGQVRLIKNKNKKILKKIKNKK